MAKGGLFEDLPEPSEAELKRSQEQALSKRLQGAPRLREPDRSQVELRASDLESLLPQDHRARLVWGYRRSKQSRHNCETKVVTPPLMTTAGQPKPSNGAGFQGLRSKGVTSQSMPAQRSKVVTAFLMG